MRIEKRSEGQATIFRLIGRIQAEHLPALLEELNGETQGVVLDLGEVTLVDVDVVRFLSDRETSGVALRNCSAYIREWILRERR